MKDDIDRWQSLLQPAVNDGVYRCGFARTQAAYDRAETDLFSALEQAEQALEDGRSWFCGDQLTLADVRLFPTLIRWELVYAPLFGCSRRPLWQRLMSGKLFETGAENSLKPFFLKPGGAENFWK